MENKAYLGTVVDTSPDGRLRVFENCLMVVDVAGKIVFKEEATPSNLCLVKERYSIEPGEIVRLRSTDEFLMPGFIDSHIHASQIPNCGTGLDLTLLEWLTKYTFPLEKRYEDVALARKYYQAAVDMTLAQGTTTAAYYGTIHRESSEVLCDLAESSNQRALVGKVCMNRNGWDGYQETTTESLSETELFVKGVLCRGFKLVSPVVTPRFAPSCDNELMVGLSDIASRYGVRIQSHLSENRNEVEWVRKLHPEARDYTQVYKKAGLLTDRTIMAHCIHLSDGELKDLRDTGTGVAHCPNSNNTLMSGILDVLRMQDLGIKVGLGTDCSAGFSPSMLDAIRFAVCTSNTNHILSNSKHIMNGNKAEDLNHGEGLRKTLNFEGALTMATRGSAAVCGLDDKVGSFDLGMEFDAIRVNLTKPETLAGGQQRKPAACLFGHESVADMVQKFIYLGDDRNIVQVYVSGRLSKNCI